MQTAETQEYTIAEFIAEHGLVMRYQQVDHNPHMDEATDMDHWFCAIMTRDGRAFAEYKDEPSPMYRLTDQYVLQGGGDTVDGRMNLVFSMGSGHHGKVPGLADVLDCLASDAATIDNAQSFEDWAAGLGLNEDSRKAEATFKACEEQAAQLKDLLSHEAYETLLYETERL